MRTWLVAVPVVLAGVWAPLASMAGFASLGLRPPPRRLLLLCSLAAGSIAGVAAVAATARFGSLWWLPALLVWSIGLAASATCDGFTQRIPTTVIRVAASASSALLLLACLGTHDWHRGVKTLITVAVSGILVGACWRFAGAGFGDVRLAALGGLGLGASTGISVLCGALTFAALVFVQGVWTMIRAGDRHVMVPLGPALAVGLLVAAAV